MNVSKTYESYFVTLAIKRTHTLLSYVQFLQNSFLIKLLAYLPWKSILIVSFFLSLVILPTFTIQLTTFPSSAVNDLVLNQRQFGIPITSFSNIILVLLLVSLAAQRRFRFTAVDILFVCFYLVAAVSVIMASNIDASFTSLLKLTYGLIVYFVFSQLFLTKRQLSLIMYTALGIIFFQGFLAIAQFIKGGLIGIPIENIRSLVQSEGLFPIQDSLYFRVVGTLSHPSILATFIALLAPITIALRFLQRDLKHVVVLHIATILCIVIQLLAASRWGLITTFFALIYTAVLLHNFTSISLRKTFQEAKIDILVVLLILPIVFLHQTFFVRFTQFSLEDASFIVRSNLVSQALSMIKEQPLFGVGIGGFTAYMQNYDLSPLQIANSFPAPVHNAYLLVASEMGMIGLVLFLALPYMLMKLFLKSVKSLSKETKLIAISLFSSFGVYFFNGLWDPRTFGDRIGFLFLFLLGILVNILSRRSN